MIFFAWFAIAFFHGLFLLFKMFPHFNKGYEHYIWLFFWIYNPSSLDDEGQKIRRILLTTMIVYFVIGFLIARLNQ